MAISVIATIVNQSVEALTSAAGSPVVANPDADISASQTAVGGITGNNSSLSVAVAEEIAQMNGGANLTNLLTPASQQSGSDFMGSLLTTLEGLDPSNSASINPLLDLFGNAYGQNTPALSRNPASATFDLQTSIQTLISQLDGSNEMDCLLDPGANANTSSGLVDLQQSFNNLITSNGGYPSQASLPSFLQTVAANIDDSTFDTIL